jgi:hypothetical protein
MTLTIKGKAFNDIFNNLYLGDDGSEDLSALASDTEIGGIRREKAKTESSIEYLREFARQGGSQQADYRVMKALATSYKGSEKKVRDALSKKLKQLKKQLDAINEPNGSFTFHDVVSTLCNSTLKAFASDVLKLSELRVVYGDANSKSGELSGTSLADIPIDRKRLDSMFRGFVETGQLVPTLKVFLDELIRVFLENEDIWKKQEGEDIPFNKPEIIVYFTNNGSRAELHILDVKQGLPVTLSNVPDGKASVASVESDVINSAESGREISILRPGNAGSFIKKLSLSQISDQAMKAAFIARMHEDRLSGIRDASRETPTDAVKSKRVTPLTLPLQGSMSVLGHPEWKPFKAFYLSTGLFIVDGIYKVMGVTHTIGPGGFTTDLDLMYN